MTGKRIHQDPFDHERYRPFLKARSQAWFRGEDWDLTFEDFCQLWTWDHWQMRGKGSSDFAMARIDCEKGWNLDNCEIVTRRQQLRRNNLKKRQLREREYGSRY
jgi:hypothetical protein